MTCHKELTQATGIAAYFCDPHSPWQKGSCENMNGLLRQYLPRGEDLSLYGQQELDAIADKLNNRPRQILDWNAPHQVFESFLHTRLRAVSVSCCTIMFTGCCTSDWRPPKYNNQESANKYRQADLPLGIIKSAPARPRLPPLCGYPAPVRPQSIPMWHSVLGTHDAGDMVPRCRICPGNAVLRRKTARHGRFLAVLSSP